MLGDGIKRVMPDEAAVAQAARRSACAARDLPAGHVLATQDVVCLRPAGGIAPDRVGPLMGRVLVRAGAGGRAAGARAGEVGNGAMCGIAGYIRDAPLPQARLAACLALMRRRGPDARDMMSLETAQGRHLHLLHSRLAIIDLDPRSNQPFGAGTRSSPITARSTITWSCGASWRPAAPISRPRATRKFWRSSWTGAARPAGLRGHVRVGGLQHPHRAA